jgi:hypothetical protein
MHPNGWDRGLQVTADGNGLVGHGGAILLRELADRSGLTAGLDAALARPGTSPQVSRGMALVSTAIAIAVGATAMADIGVLGQLSPVRTRAIAPLDPQDRNGHEDQKQAPAQTVTRREKPDSLRF